jgi:hypothetical protein
MNGFYDFGDLNPIVLAVVTLTNASGMAAEDVFTLHPSECTSTR